MAYRTKVEVRTNGRVFKPGSILPENVSKSDLDFLKRKKFIELAEVADAAMDNDFSEPAEGEDFDEMDPGEFKGAEEIKRIRRKENVYTYAASIGLDLGDNFKEKSLNELHEAVINYQEEAESEATE